MPVLGPGVLGTALGSSLYSPPGKRARCRGPLLGSQELGKVDLPYRCVNRGSYNVAASVKLHKQHLAPGFWRRGKAFVIVLDIRISGETGMEGDNLHLNIYINS